MMDLFADKPEVSISRLSDDVLEEDHGSVTLRCLSDSNPRGRVFWRKYGGGGHNPDDGDARQYVETLEFAPVRRKDSGTYICQAENTIGLSNEKATELDVLCEYHLQKPLCFRGRSHEKYTNATCHNF